MKGDFFCLKSIYIFFPLFIDQVVILHKSIFFFHAFVNVLLQCVICVGFRRLVIMGTSILSDLDDNTYLIIQIHQFKSISSLYRRI